MPLEILAGISPDVLPGILTGLKQVIEYSFIIGVQFQRFSAHLSSMSGRIFGDILTGHILTDF